MDVTIKTSEFKEIIHSYQSITKTMVDSHCEIMWADNSGTDSGRHPTANYVAGLYDPAKQAVQAQKRLMHKMLDLCNKNSLATNYKSNLRYFNSVYTFNA